MDLLKIAALAAAVALGSAELWMQREKNILRPTGEKKRGSHKVSADCSEYYRLYKYMYMQQSIGISPFETIRRLYLITEHSALRALLYEMSVVVSNSSDIGVGLSLLKQKLVGNDSALFINILENSMRTGFSALSMRQLDGMFFQKYLVEIKNRVKKAKRQYFRAALLFCAAVFVAIFLPVADQMLRSLQSVFATY